MLRCKPAFWLLTGLLTAAASVTGSVAMADEDERPGAVTDLAEVDEDFALQGEYAGPVRARADSPEWKNIGLQVVARGDGEFDAIQYEGGLPGAGWNRKDRVHLEGERADGVVQLEGGPLAVTVEEGAVTVRDSGFQTLGRIPKVHRVSPTMGARPPYGATVLFDGTGTEYFQRGEMTDDGLLREGALTEQAFRDFSLHVEFRLPYMPVARGQGRANSGVYLQRRYEVQILDSFGLEGGDNDCGSLYRFRPPALNMTFPPLSWQTFDIEFRAARFDDEGEKVQNARVTVWHNGIVIHNDVELEGPTGAGRDEGPDPLPIYFQDHGDPVHFRNIWLIDHDAPTPPRHPTMAGAPVHAVPVHPVPGAFRPVYAPPVHPSLAPYPPVQHVPVHPPLVPHPWLR